MVYGQQLPWYQQQHIFYRGTDGGIYHVFWDAANGAVLMSPQTDQLN
jgi:hypothetical protein